MYKKAIVSTVLFTLIIINLILWPSLFSDFQEGDAESGGQRDEVLQGGESEAIVDKDLDVDLDESLVDGEDGLDADEENDESSSKTDEQGNVFKILRIE